MTEAPPNGFDPGQYIRNLLWPLLDHPEAMRVETSRSVNGYVTTIEVFVKGSDLGKVIGREGRTFDAVSLLLERIRGNPTLKVKTRYVLRVDRVEEGTT